MVEKNKDCCGGLRLVEPPVRRAYGSERVMEYWSGGKEQELGYWSAGVLECWKRIRTGVLGKARTGVVEYWSGGKEQKLGYWSDGVLECWKRTRTGVMEYRNDGKE